MNIKKFLMLIVVLASSTYAFAQITDAEKDSLYIQQIEDHKEPDTAIPYLEFTHLWFNLMPLQPLVSIIYRNLEGLRSQFS